MSVFGEILFLSNVSGTIVFVAVMIFLTIFEACKWHTRSPLPFVLFRW